MFGLIFMVENNDSSEILNTLCYFRDKIRRHAFTNKQYNLLKITDEIRDVCKQKLNISIEDVTKEVSVWKHIN